MGMEQEVGSMVMRLVGDGSSYRSMMQQAASSTASTASSIQKNTGVIQGFVKTVESYAHRAARSVKGLAASMANIATMGVSSSLGSMGAGMVPGLLGLAGAGGALAGAGWGISLAREAEKAAISFEVMLGSAEAGKKMLAEITDFAAKTPFEMPGLRSAAQMMLNFGVTQDRIMPTLKALGDVAAGDQNKLNGLAYAYSQTQAAGRLMGQDLMQMINWGFNPLQEMSRKSGKSIAVLKAEMEKGAISAKMVEDAFISASGPGGKFFNMMEKQSTTIDGLMSTMADTVKMKVTEIGVMLVDTLNLKAVLAEAIKFTETYGTILVEGVRSAIQMIASMWRTAGKMMQPFISVAKSGFAYIVQLAKWAYTGISDFAQNWGFNMNILWKWLGENWFNILKDMLSIFGTFSSNLIHNATVLLRMIGELFVVLVKRTIKHLFSYEFQEYILTALINTGIKIRSWLASIAEDMRSVFMGKNLKGNIDKFVIEAAQDVKTKLNKGQIGKKAKTMSEEMSEIVAKNMKDMKGPLDGFASSITEMPQFRLGKQVLMPQYLKQIVDLGMGLIPAAKVEGEKVGAAYTGGVKNEIAAIEAIQAGSTKAYDLLESYRSKMAVTQTVNQGSGTKPEDKPSWQEMVTHLSELVKQGREKANSGIELALASFTGGN